MSSAAVKRYTVEVFYKLEARSLDKHQYYNGEIFLLHPPDEQGMAGASASHNLIVGNLVASSHNALKGCRVFPSDMLVKCPSDLRSDPDVTIVCGKPEYENEKVLIAANRPVIPHYRRHNGDRQWLLRTVTGRESALELPSLSVRLPLTEIYANVELPDHVPLLDVGRYDPDNDPPLIPPGS